MLSSTDGNRHDWRKDFLFETTRSNSIEYEAEKKQFQRLIEQLNQDNQRLKQQLDDEQKKNETIQVRSNTLSSR